MKPITIQSPLDGKWKCLRPPGHHPLAVDFVQVKPGEQVYHDAPGLHFYFSRIASERFYCWNRPVYAPVTGKVIRASNDWQDNEYVNLWQTIRIWYNATYKFRPRESNNSLDIRPNAGNHVMIQANDGYIVFLAHLREKSVGVEEGEQVQQGQLIGAVGNSGNSTMPHLHINVFDQMDDPFSAEVLPFVFDHYEVLSKTGQSAIQQNALPETGALLNFTPAC